MFFAVWLWFLLAADHKSQSSRALQAFWLCPVSFWPSSCLRVCHSSEYAPMQVLAAEQAQQALADDSSKAFEICVNLLMMFASICFACQRPFVHDPGMSRDSVGASRSGCSSCFAGATRRNKIKHIETPSSPQALLAQQPLQALKACLFLIGEHLGQSCGHIHIVRSMRTCCSHLPL